MLTSLALSRSLGRTIRFGSRRSACCAGVNVCNCDVGITAPRSAAGSAGSAKRDRGDRQLQRRSSAALPRNQVISWQSREPGLASGFDDIGAPYCEGKLKLPTSNECAQDFPHDTASEDAFGSPPSADAPEPRSHAAGPEPTSTVLNPPRCAEAGRRNGVVRSPCHDQPSAHGRCQLSRQDLVQQQDHRALTWAGRDLRMDVDSPLRGSACQDREP